MKYLLDANVFLQAANIHYPIGTFPSVWHWLDGFARQEDGVVFVLDAVFDEVAKDKTDEVALWMKDIARSVWRVKSEDKKTQRSFAEIANWVNANPQYSGPAKNAFLSGADPWLVAKAKVEGMCIVSQEVSAPQSKSSIKLPDVSQVFEIHCINTIAFMRELEARF